jgi:hypothetical protein
MIKDPDNYSVECCNPKCCWIGLKSETVMFKHDRDNPNALLLCPKCNEVCEPIDFDK